VSGLPGTLRTSGSALSAVGALPTNAGPDPTLTIVAFGTPGPQGSKSFKGMTAKGNALLVESSKKVKPWRRAVVDAAQWACLVARKEHGLDKWVPLDGPIEVSMVFTLRKPVSAPKRTRTWPTKYPDVSKLCRSTEDALTSAGVWCDDARVVRYRDLAKVFPGEDPAALAEPGVVVQIWQVSA
jgi:crossover junction endodeoxyribonuclease RusA